MNEENPTTSGSRWEPTPDADDAATAEVSSPTDQPSDLTSEQPAPADHAAYAETPPPAGRSWPSRARAAVAGVAAAALVAVGLGGFAIGRATAGDGDEPGIQQVGFQQDGDSDGDRHGDGHGFGDRDGDGFEPPEGGLPPGGPGQVPGTAPDGTTEDGTTDDGTTSDGDVT